MHVWYVIVTTGTNLNCSEVKISHISYILRNFITLCFPELKLQFVMLLRSVFRHYKCFRKGTKLGFSFYWSVFLMTALGRRLFPFFIHSAPVAYN